VKDGAVASVGEHAVGDGDVVVDVQVQAAAEALGKTDGAAASAGYVG
jgi:hypothetical protein